MPAPTRREAEILLAVCETGSTKGAAGVLGITDSTVRHGLAALRRRCGYRSTAQAAWRERRELERLARSR